MSKQNTEPQLTPQTFLQMLLGWLVPGAPFFFKKAYLRGIALFAIIMLTFVIGIALNGGVIWPIWVPGDEGFNIVNCLTFLVQLGCGLPSLISLAASQGIILDSIQPKEWHPFFDLASFYILISGAMNYFILMNFYDRYYNPKYRNLSEAQ
jgi:hypothetical protein